MATSKISESCVIICLLGLTSVICVSNSECISPLGPLGLGMENGTIKDSQITVTGVHRTVYGGHALHAKGIWCVDASGGSMTKINYKQYIQIDLLSLTNITGIATQGREYNEGREAVENYTISYRKDGGVWYFYRGKGQAVKEFPGNKNVSTVVRQDLDAAILARYIRVHPVYGAGNTKTCMRLVEIYGCTVKAILSYSMPVGQTTKNGKVHYKDTSYNGVITNDFYKDGTGILTDGKIGRVIFTKEYKGERWVGWSSLLTQSQYIDITFEFSGVRKFTDVTLTVNGDKKRGNAVFNGSQIFFSSTKDGFSDTSILQCYPKYSGARNDPYNAPVTLSLCGNTARFIKLRLYFGGKWLLITEISFNSVAVSGNEKKSFQNCSGDTTSSTCIVIRSFASTKSGYIETTNSIVMFFMGAGATLAIVLIVLFVILIIYKRRRQASELPISVDRVGMENQAVEAETESPPNNNQGLDHVGPTSGRTAPYEEIPIISPSSVYEVFSRNSQNGSEATNSDPSSVSVIPAANGRTSPYSVVQIISPPFVHEMLNRNRPDGRELERANSDRSSAYVIPANGRITPYRIVQIAPPSSVHNDHNRNQSDGRETRNSDCSSGYEEVQILSLSGYTELDKNRADETNDHTYQKLVKPDSDYLIPTHAGAEPSCVEDGKIKTTPGYTELDNTKRAQDA